MIHNKKKCGAAKRADKLGIPHCHISHEDEDQIIQLMQAWRVELIILAGWMRIVSPKLINAFSERIINVHPSLLPKYKGLHAVEQALESGDTETGASVHFVDEGLDTGQVIIQRSVPIEPDDTVESLTRRIQLMEYSILPVAINELR